MVSKSKTTQLATHVYRPLSKSAADIIKLLQTKKEASYKELADELGIDPSSIGKHIRKLQDEGLLIRYRKNKIMVAKWVGGVSVIEQELLNATNTRVAASILAECYDDMITSAFAIFSILYEDNYWEIIMNLAEGLTDLELGQRIGAPIPLDSIRRVLVICDAHNLIKLNRIRDPAIDDSVILFQSLYKIEHVNKDFLNYMVIIRGLASAMQYRMENKKSPGYTHPFEPLLDLNIEWFRSFKEFAVSKTNLDEQKLLLNILSNYDYSEDLDRIYRQDNWRVKAKASHNINVGSTSSHVLLSDDFANAAKKNITNSRKGDLI